MNIKRIWLIHWWDICEFRDDEDNLAEALLEYVDSGWDTEHPLNRNIPVRVG